ncbi:MAG: amidohydrolase [Clostridia bacterium]|nr:amidohydrolase [Clostridia bacterium]
MKILLKNGLIYPMTQKPFAGDLLIEDGRIAALGPQLPCGDAELYDLAGCHILPGFVDAHCHIGMWEDGMGQEGADGNEYSDPLTPQCRGIDGLNPFDPCFKEALAAGVTTVVTGPGSANVIGGTFAALKTFGRGLDEMLMQDPVAMKAAVGENPKNAESDKKAPLTRMAIAALFRKAMAAAEDYRRKLADPDESKRPDRDLGLEALLPVLEGRLRLKIHAHRADDILSALRLAEEFHLDVSIDHCTEGHLIADILREKLQKQRAGVIVGPLLSERSKIELKNMSYDAPRILHEAGIEFAIMTDHPVIPIQYLPVEAALAVRAGLDEETALKAITIHAARVAGLADRVGSLEPGKDADVAVFSAHPFDFRARCEMTFVRGRLAWTGRAG